MTATRIVPGTTQAPLVMPYPAPRWLRGGHLQTIYPAKCIRKPAVAYRRVRWQAPDGDFIDIDFVDGPSGAQGPSGSPNLQDHRERPFVLLFHGLEGSSNSHYARALMAQVTQRGWCGAVVHFRGCSGELNLSPRFYHSGDAQEVNWIVRRLHAHHRAQTGGRFYIAGVSLGANALLRWLGEYGHDAEIVDAVCAVSAPLDLTASGAALSSSANYLYTRIFLQTLKPKCLQKLDQFPGLFDREQMLHARNLYEFDNIVTAPLHGYRNTEDYWHRASAKHVLNDITVPTLILNACNDPFLPARYLPQSASPSVQLEYPQQGGHVGFTTGNFPGSLMWLPQRMLHFFSSIHDD